MKIICINNTEKNLTINKEYFIITDYGDTYYITDDAGYDNIFYKWRFITKNEDRKRKLKNI